MSLTGDYLIKKAKELEEYYSPIEEEDVRCFLEKLNPQVS